MPPLAGDLRNDLERTVIAARDTAEAAAKAVLATLAVERSEPFATMDEAQRRLRRGLRARARQLGGGEQDAGIAPLVEEIAYQQWHRLLFARFLAENGLLMHPQGVPVSLQECAELAREEGAADAWELAARYTGQMLPGLFDPQNPAMLVRLAPEDRQELQQSVEQLPAAVFTADDSLGWTYQFWQSKKKKEVNRSGRKIGGADIGPVTQLFTEDYMVRFLLENSLGAWWAARHPDSPLVKEFEYLRYRDDGTPAAGTFPGWPEHAAEVTVMDPCCGSGHFIVAAFDMLRRMRMEEEGLSEAAAVVAVLRDNLFGLEIDPRCTQIAAFALLFAAWKAGGYRALPVPNIACSGIAAEGQLEDWLKLAGADSRLSSALERLNQLFREAPTLGSLIDPTSVPLAAPMFVAEYDEVAPLLEKALARERGDPVAAVLGSSARGVAKAARLLAGTYTFVATNVPYLGRGMQSESLKQFMDVAFPESKADLATACLERCLRLAGPNGSVAVVTPQNWLFLSTYKRLRKRILAGHEWNLLARLGTRAFRAISGEVVNVALLVLSNPHPGEADTLVGLDATDAAAPEAKEEILRSGSLQYAHRSAQLRHPDSRVVLGHLPTESLLGRFAQVFEGMHSGDYVRFGRKFWELGSISKGWVFQQGGPDATVHYAGREHVLFWEDGRGELMDYVRERLASETVTMWIKGSDAWGKNGVAVSVMSSLKATLYTGEVFTHGVVAIIPRKGEHLGAIWSFCRSPEFARSIRRIDQKVSVARASFDSVPFDLAHWQRLAERTGHLPEPSSSDPTQWLFGGQPVGSVEPLQVAVARLLDYHWPQQKADTLADWADSDGIVCLPPVAGEQPAAERLRALLAAAYGDEWSLAVQQRLLAEADFGNQDLADWLRDGYFQQHCRLFRNRPFIWHIWDGRKDGFSALVNYHRLDRATLEKLIYTYLGQWIEAQRAEQARDVAGADGRLVAALELKKKLEAIRDGEPPYDIYVRWKPLHEQPIGWEPDLNDGVRLNIRPFVKAGVLRSKFTIHWRKDRGKDPDGSERINDLHLTLEEKRAARQAH